MGGFPDQHEAHREESGRGSTLSSLIADNAVPWANALFRCAGDSTAHWLYKEGSSSGKGGDNCAAKEASWAKFKVSQQVRQNSEAKVE